MRKLLAAAAVAAAVAQTASAAPRPQTVYTLPTGRIAAFAQDENLLSWFTSPAHGCNSVSVYSLVDAVTLQLPLQGASDENVTCRWDVVPPVRLALAGTTVLWALRETAPVQFDYVLGAGVHDRAERRFQEIAHASRGAGLWLGGISGDGSTLVYAVTNVAYVDEVACLSNPKAKGACSLERSGGGVYRVVGRTARAIPGTPASVLVAAASGRIADVPTASVAPDGQPLASRFLAIEVRDASSGKVGCSVRPKGVPIALGLSSSTLATLERTPIGLRLAWYSGTSCKAAGSVPVPKATTAELSVSAHVIVFHTGREIRVVDTRTHGVRGIARAASTPIGLSVEGSRIAWGENVKGRGRIRELVVTPAP